MENLIDFTLQFRSTLFNGNSRKINLKIMCDINLYTQFIMVIVNTNL